MRTEPFSDNLDAGDLMELPGVLSVKSRTDYILRTGGIMVLTGDPGSGKSTALRWALGQYHPSEVTFFYVTANSGSSNELYKQLCWALRLDIRSGSKAFLLKRFKEAVGDIAKENRNRTVVVIDEASLLRSDVFAELHTLNQFYFDSEKKFSLILSGQNSLVDKLKYRSSAPLASRVMTRSHLSALDEGGMEDYIGHHLKMAGVKGLFAPNALTAIWQGSGGLLRTANFLAKGTLISCMNDNQRVADEEHVRKASTELIL